MTRSHLVAAAIVGTILGRSLAEPGAASAPAGPAPVPVIYSTDLLHPHDDPDDHFDLATLFAVREFDIRAILLDLGERQEERPGRIVLEQMFALTGRTIPWATGLASKLEAPSDDGRKQPAGRQGAVELLMRTLAESPAPVTVITAGSLRDFSAAFNRAPELFRRKISRLYINVGHADGGDEWNVMLDPHAYVAVMRSGLPIFWCPCQPFRDPRSTFWEFDHPQVLERAPTRVQNFFIYALQAVPPDLIDPVAALDQDFRPFRHLVWKMHRQMWCTGPFLHAAGLRPVATQAGKFELRPIGAGGETPKEIFAFVPARVEIDDAARTRTADGPPNMQAFRITDVAAYNSAMTGVLAHLLETFPLADKKP